MLRAHLATLLGLTVLSTSLMAGCADDTPTVVPDEKADENAEDTVGATDAHDEHTSTPENTNVSENVDGDETAADDVIDDTANVEITNSTTTSGDDKPDSVGTHTPEFDLETSSTSTSTMTGGTATTSDVCVSDDDCSEGDAQYCMEGTCVTCADTVDPDASCAGTDATLPACSTVGQCVECTGSNDDACDGDTPFCDEATNTCTGCSEDNDCDVACNTVTGECIDSDDAVYVKQSGKCDDSGDGTTDEPFCKIAAAINDLDDDDGVIIILGKKTYNENLFFTKEAQVALVGADGASVEGNPYYGWAIGPVGARGQIGKTGEVSHPPFTPTITIEGDGTEVFLTGLELSTGDPEISSSEDRPALSVISCSDDAVAVITDLEIDNLGRDSTALDIRDCEATIMDSTFEGFGNRSNVIYLTDDGLVTLDGVEAENMEGVCLQVETGDLNVRNSRLLECGGSLNMTDGFLNISNTVIANNGQSNYSRYAAVQLSDVTIEDFSYNTIVNSQRGEKGGPVANSKGIHSTIDCSGDGVEGVIRNNILSASSKNSIATNCSAISDVFFTKNAMDDSDSDFESDGNTDVGDFESDWFEDADDFDFHLVDDGLDAMKDTAERTSSNPTIDIDGDIRPDVGYAGVDQPQADESEEVGDTAN